MTAEIIDIFGQRNAPSGCPRCGTISHQVELGGWRWGTCRTHGLKWKISTAIGSISATDTDSAIRILGDYWPTDRHGGAPDAA